MKQCNAELLSYLGMQLAIVETLPNIVTLLRMSRHACLLWITCRSDTFGKLAAQDETNHAFLQLRMTIMILH